MPRIHEEAQRVDPEITADIEKHEVDMKELETQKQRSQSGKEIKSKQRNGIPLRVQEGGWRTQSMMLVDLDHEAATVTVTVVLVCYSTSSTVLPFPTAHPCALSRQHLPFLG